MNQLILFDYDQLDLDTRTSLKQRAERINERSRKMAVDIWEIGREFAEAQRELAQSGPPYNGLFLKWAEHETGYNYRTVYRYIDVYNSFKFDNLSNLRVATSALYALAAPSTPDEARQEAIDRAEDGEVITHQAAQGIIASHHSCRDPVETETEVYSLFNPNIDEDEDDMPDENNSQLSQPMQVLLSHESVEYYTPPVYIEAARLVMGEIDLDPASCDEAQETVRAAQFYTEADDGLSQKWHGRVWLNPPYSKTGGRSNQELWAQYLISQYEQGNVSEGLLLVKSALGYKWFEELWDLLPACFIRERLSFIKSNGSDDGESKHGTAIFYIGQNLERFTEIFSAFGRITTPDGRYINNGRITE